MYLNLHISSTNFHYILFQNSKQMVHSEETSNGVCLKSCFLLFKTCGLTPSHLPSLDQTPIQRDLLSLCSRDSVERVPASVLICKLSCVRHCYERCLPPLQDEGSLSLGWWEVSVCVRDSHTTFVLPNKLLSVHSPCLWFSCVITHFTQVSSSVWLDSGLCCSGVERLSESGPRGGETTAPPGPPWTAFSEHCTHLTGHLPVFTELITCFMCTRVCFHLVSGFLCGSFQQTVPASVVNLNCPRTCQRGLPYRLVLIQ